MTTRAARGLFAVILAFLLLVPVPGVAQDSRAVLCGYVGDFLPLPDLTRCAEQGDAEAQFKLGARYEEGYRVTRDDAEAERWYRLAAEGGHVVAQFDLGWRYGGFDRSARPPQDRVLEEDAEAARWLQLAADQGHAQAQHTLGFMYARGYGVEADPVLAHMWFALSVSRGGVYSIENRALATSNNRVLERLMAPEQIAEAQRLAREWLETHPSAGAD